MNKEIVVDKHSGILLSHNKGWNHSIYNMVALEGIMLSKTGQTERQILEITYM